MKSLYLFLALIFSTTIFANSFYDFSVKTTNGEEMAFSKLKGKTVLFVNVATRCGYTGQLDDLEKLYQKYKEKDFLIVGIPSNDFGGQTPEGDKEVAKFCRLKYGVSFPLTQKTSVKGSEKPELVKYLLNEGPEIAWNFEKFLVSKEGKVIQRFESGTVPLSKELTSVIESSL